MHLNVLLLSNQIRGLDGTGGLGDVPVGLAKELLARGDVDVRLAMPGYEEISAEGEPLLRDRFDAGNLVVGGLEVPFGDGRVRVDVYRVTLPHSQPAVTCYLFRCPEVFDAPEPGSRRVDKNTADKAILFARAALEFLRAHADFRVDLIHCNDWHTGLAPVYLNTLYRHDHYLGRVASLYTTHNCFGAAYQGGFDPAAYGGLLRLAGLEGAEVFHGGTRSLFHDWRFNFTKGGLGFADLINTVSRRYAKELQSATFAGGLQGVFQERRGAFTGVINGIDTAEWNPAGDPLLSGIHYSAADDPQQVREQKRKVRRLLRNWAIKGRHHRSGAWPFANLDDHSLLIGVVSRIDFQKSPILVRAMERLCRLEGVQIAMLGCAGHNDPLGLGFEESFRSQAAAAPDRLLFFDGFDIELSHLLYAASELFLVPSSYEPCGLTQMVAMRYGAVPLVRETGGLADTVTDERDPERANAATGYCFREPLAPNALLDEPRGADALVNRVGEAVALYRRNPQRWAQLLHNGMAEDWSWSIPSRQYVMLYQEAIRRALGRSYFG